MRTNSDVVVPTDRTQTTSAQHRTNLPHRILVVEDDSAIRCYNADVLQCSGYQVDTAEDGEAGWKALYAVSYDQDRYDLLLTDNDMPKVSGVELMRKLRAARMELPVIMATGALPAQELSRSPWLQPDATLLKPYTREQLLRTVREVLRMSDSLNEQFVLPPDWQRQPPLTAWQPG